MFHRILYATDGSDHASKAQAYALELAKQFHAAVFVVHAYAYVSELLGKPNYDNLLSLRVGEGNEVLATAARPFETAGLNVKQELLEGSPAEAILEVATTRKCDLIVMGARGLSGLEGLLLGSTSQQVIQNSPCPVLVIR